MAVCHEHFFQSCMQNVTSKQVFIYLALPFFDCLPPLSSLFPCSFPHLPVSPPYRMEYLSEVCTWRGLVGTRGTPVWWKLNPCRWSVPFPLSTSNLWKTARRQPRVSCLGLFLSRISLLHTNILKSSPLFCFILFWMIHHWFLVFFPSVCI